jgi:peptidyl-prolyl cis-trans isomerase D
VREVDDQYIVAVLVKITDEGSAELEDVRDQIEPKVKNEKKGEKILEKLNQLEGTLDEIKEQYGDDARVSTSSDLKLSTNSLPGVGFVPEAIGAAFALEQGERSNPVIVENGVIIVEMIAKTEAPEIADYSSYKNQIEQTNSGRISYEINEIIREFADIQDKRYRYF